MSHDFDQRYWDGVWGGADGADRVDGADRADRADGADRAASMADSPPNPHLIREVKGLRPGTAIDAGCGAGAEAIWLASTGWQVTAVDIADEALRRAASRAAAAGVDDRIAWQRADLSTWRPGFRFDLVTTHYAHPSIPQLDFYERIANWVAPGGTLLIVGHLHHGHHSHSHSPRSFHSHGGHHHDTHPPAEAEVTAEAITLRFASKEWEVATAAEGAREMRGPGSRGATVHDVVFRAVRRD